MVKAVPRSEVQFHINGATKTKDQVDSGELGREKLTDMLLAIVEEKTGYPRDMVGLDQSLESDLGIDSIKRIEVVGAMLQALPEKHRQQLSENRSKLNTQPTLNGMLNLISAAASAAGGAARPFDFAEAGEPAVTSRPPRHIIEWQEERIDADASMQPACGHFVITEDARGVSADLAARLVSRGCTVSLVARAALHDEAAVRAWIDEHQASFGALAGVVHLAQLDAEWLAPDCSVEDWRAALHRTEKSLFLLVRELGERFLEDAHVVSVSALGGLFGRDGRIGPGLSLQGGAVGMIKSLYEERPTLRVKAIDTDPRETVGSVTDALFAELQLAGGRQEVGYPGGRRTIFRTVAAQADVDDVRRADLRGIVVLATGGARGITAEVLRELAQPGNTLVLTGRSPSPADEPREQALLDASSLRRRFIVEARGGGAHARPADIERRVRAVLGAREMRSNIGDFCRLGASVEYHAVDVTREDDMRALIAGVYERHGRVDGVVHGAGIIEDKLLADKDGDSWSRVVETKVLGLLLLQKHLRPASLRFFSVFSSVAGRYGNSGQSDYATANELMNRLCCQLREHWQHRVNVTALCWGPWGATKFGAGMVNAQTEAKFAEKGVQLVLPDVGRRLFGDELLRTEALAVEIVCGEAAWERREAEKGLVKRAPARQPSLGGALLDGARRSSLPKGEQVIALSLDANHAYLRQHRIDGIPVLPAAVALEMMAEAARALWEGWKVVEVRDCRLMKGVDLKEPDRSLLVVLNPATYGSSEGFDVVATVQSEPENGRRLIHYKAVLRLEQQLPAGYRHLPKVHGERDLAVRQAYDEWLFHGPCFQTIQAIGGLSSAGATATVRSTRPAQWLQRVAAGDDRWVFDPGLVDAAAQMALLWARAFRDEASLPTRFGRVVRYRDALPERVQMAFERHAGGDANVVHADVHFVDERGDVVLLVEGMECVASPALKRLGGTARVLEVSA